jgi:hypothetical protein
MVQNDETPARSDVLPRGLGDSRKTIMVSTKAGLMRPPMLRMIAASPGSSPRISKGSALGSRHPIIVVFVEGMIFKLVAKSARANLSFHSVIVAMKSIPSPSRIARITS